MRYVLRKGMWVKVADAHCVLHDHQLKHQRVFDGQQRVEPGTFPHLFKSDTGALIFPATLEKDDFLILRTGNPHWPYIVVPNYEEGFGGDATPHKSLNPDQRIRSKPLRNAGSNG